jgi:hypothetical protein
VIAAYLGTDESEVNMSEPLLEFREVDVFYGVIQALKQVSLRSIRGNRGADWRKRRG